MSFRCGLWKKGKLELQSGNPYSKELHNTIKILTNKCIFIRVKLKLYVYHSCDILFKFTFLITNFLQCESNG